MIPKKIYFNFGFAPDFGGKPFGLVHYLAIKSAKEINQCDVVMYYQYAPSGNEWWEKSKQYCQHVHCTPPTTIFGNKLHHVAYQSDVFRLQVLIETGGIYLDSDTISIRPFNPLLSKKFIMAREVAGGKLIGLCNAVMMAEKGSEFGKTWLEEYRKYNSDWGYMSVIVPMNLSAKYPTFISIEPQDSFFKYGWSEEEIKAVHEKVSDMSGAYVLHLWEQKTYTKYLAPMTVNDIYTRDTTYNLLARTFL